MPKDFGEIIPEREKLEGEKTDKDSIFNHVIEVKRWIPLPSQYEGKSEYALIQAVSDKKLITFTGGEALTNQLKSIKPEDFPFMAKLSTSKGKKGNKYYVFVSAR
jgi:hypothetical protein